MFFINLFDATFALLQPLSHFMIDLQLQSHS